MVGTGHSAIVPRHPSPEVPVPKVNHFWYTFLFLVLILLMFFSKDATIYSFNGEQFFQVSMAKEMKSQAESFSVRFRTDKSEGLLLATTHHRASHQFTIY